MTEDWIWPEWVPEKVQREVENFWRKDLGRSSTQWLESARKNGAPEFGDITYLRTLGDWNKFATGRYVHAWNNIGRVVHDDGSFSYVSVHHLNDKDAEYDSSQDEKTVEDTLESRKKPMIQGTQEYSEKEHRLFEYFGLDELSSRISPAAIYRICVEKCFIDNTINEYSESLRRCIIAWNASKIHRLTPEWDSMIYISSPLKREKTEVINVKISMDQRASRRVE